MRILLLPLPLALLAASLAGAPVAAGTPCVFVDQGPPPTVGVGCITTTVRLGGCWLTVGPSDPFPPYDPHELARFQCPD